jgi:hypothetical protein
MTTWKPLGAAILLVTLVLPVKASDAAVSMKDCTNSGSACGLSGVDRRTLLKSLRDGMKDMPRSSLAAPGIGFPADVVAVAYGIDDPGREFSLRGTLGAIALFPIEVFDPHYYSYQAQRIMIPRLERKLALAKIHMAEPSGAPALVTVNVPGIGPQIYDADQIRALVATDLFPYPMHVEWKRSSGVTVPYIQLGRTALFARNCLIEMVPLSKDSPVSASDTVDAGCPQALGSGSQPHGGPVAVPRTPKAYAAFEDSPDMTKDAEDSQKMGTIEKILVRQTKGSITIQTRPCKLSQELQRNRPSQSSPEKVLACEFESALFIPRTAGAAYSEIRITVTVLKPKEPIPSLLCGPADKELDVTSGDRVVSPGRPCTVATWRLSGDILSPPPGGDPNEPAQTLTTYIEHQRSSKDPVYVDDQADNIRQMFQVEIKLKGTLKPWWEDIVAQAWGDQTTYRWCVPGPCPNP